MKAIILAGGEGTRLRPLTVGRPKPLIPVVNRPIMGHVLLLLKRHHIQEAIITTAYMSNLIQDYFGDGHSLGMELRYVVEDRPLGTAGAVKNARNFIDDTFLVISGDVMTDFNLTELIETHRQHGGRATMALYRAENPLEYGIVALDEEEHVLQFLEKPSWGEVISDTINAGIYVLDPDILDLIPDGRPTDWSRDVFPRLLETYPGSLYGHPLSGYWKDVGTLPAYIQATNDVLRGKIRIDPLGREIAPGIWVQNDVDIAPTATLRPPLFLGNGVSIKSNAYVEGPSVLRDYCMIDTRAQVERSIIWRNSYVGEAVEVRGAIVGRQCSIKGRSLIFEGAVIGDETNIGEGAIIHSGVKIWPRKEIESGAVVRQSIVWGTQGRRSLFGRFGITGVVNVDLTPELCAKFGVALGAVFPEGSYVVINRDPHRGSRMLKRALIAGLPSAGVNVWDTHSVPIPVARYYTARAAQAVAGLHVRLSPFDSRVVDIRVFGADGQNLDKQKEREIERVFFREDFRRAPIEKIGIIADAPAVVDMYVNGFVQTLEHERIRELNYKIVVDYAYSPNADILPDILSALHVDVIPLNAHVIESKVALAEEAQEQWRRELARIVRAVGRDLGFQLDVGGEKLFIVDNQGEMPSPELTALVVIDLAMRYATGKGVVVPITMPNVVEQIVGFHGGWVRRTRYDLQSLMRESADPNVVLALDGRGHFIFPQFQPVPDALYASVKILELLSKHHATFREVAALLPEFHMANTQVPCGWEQKGHVMHRLTERLRDYNVDTLDGIKVWLDDGDWVLVRPDPDRPILHIDAESSSVREAQTLVDRYRQLVEELKQEP